MPAVTGMGNIDEFFMNGDDDFLSLPADQSILSLPADQSILSGMMEDGISEDELSIISAMDEEF
jgi:chitinase